MALARALVQRCGSRIDGPSLIDLTGCSLAEGIAHAGYAQFYICHHGTQQHKIGWLYPTPGLVHTNPSITATQPAGWVADQSEIAVAPAYLPIDLVEHADTVTERPGQSYFADYRFKRPAAAAAAMAGAMRRTLSLA
jgi:hypothetical protein